MFADFLRKLGGRRFTSSRWKEERNEGKKGGREVKERKQGAEGRKQNFLVCHLVRIPFTA